MAKNPGNMTYEQLEAELQKLNNQKAALKDRLRDVAKLMDERIVEQRVADMSDGERQALAQALQAQGIESGEAFGRVGG